MMATRSAELARVRKTVQAKLPAAVLTTNDDANPATPMSITATWRRGSIVKTVRADSVRDTPEQFTDKALRVLVSFQENNVPTKAQVVQPE